MAVAAFDYGLWSARFPELAGNVSSQLASAFFAEATFFLDNTDASPVTDPVQRLTLLNLIVAHIAQCNGKSTANGSPTGVGRVGSATQGSISVSYAPYGANGSDDAAYFNQTPYGAQYWDMVSPYRRFNYVAAPQVYTGIGFPYGNRW